MPLVKVRKSYQVTILKKIGKKIGLEEGDYLEVEAYEQGILLTPMKAIFISKKQLTKKKVLELVRQGEITSSHGAELLDMAYQDFLDLMHKEGIPLWNYTKEIMKETDRTESTKSLPKKVGQGQRKWSEVGFSKGREEEIKKLF